MKTTPETEAERHERAEREAPEDVKAAVWERDSGQCQACGTAGEGRIHFHHVVYRSQGGKDRYDNLVLLCMRCHDALHRGFIDVSLVELPDGRLAAFCNRKYGRNK